MSISGIESRLRRRLGADDGVTIIEVMVAAMILVIGAFAIFKIVDAATRTSYRAEQSQVVSNLLQRELEKVKALDVNEIAVDDTCALELPSELAGDSGTAARWDTAAGTFDGRAWVVADAGVETPINPCEAVSVAEDEGTEVSDVSVDVYRMITWYDPDNPECEPPDPEVEPDNACGMRRIIIGAKPLESGPGGERAYREIQSDVVNVPPESE